MTKRTEYVHTLDELELLVKELVDTGDNQVTIKMNPLLYAEPETFTILERLVDLQPKSTPCRLWEGAKTPAGYGRRMVENKVRYVHRLAYCEAHNLSLADIESLKVLHTCDTPSCYNPDHLFLGTQKENVVDCVQKGRRAVRQPGNQKITQEQAVKIRDLYASGIYSQQALADQFDVVQTTICKIIHEKEDAPPRRNQTDVETSRKAEEAPETEETQEVVSYSQEAPQIHQGIGYRIEQDPQGFRVKILTPCGGEMEPWDFALSTFDDAVTHAHAYIDQLENPGKAQ